MKARRWLAPVLACLLALSACTGDTPEEQERIPLVAQSINAQERDALAEGGELRLGVPALGQTYNPLHTGSTGSGTHTLPYLPNFFHYDSTGAATPNPDFVSAVEASGSPTVVTLTLNSSAVWGDGAPLTWQDVAATVAACNGSNPQFQCASNRYAPIAGVERGTTDQQVVITFTDSYPDWANVFRGVSTLRASSVADPATFNNQWTTPRNEWLSGPYTFDRIDPALKLITWVRNPKWWGAAPELERLTYKEIAPDASAAAYLNNQIDAFTIGIDPDGQRRAQGAADGDVRIAASGDSRELIFNTRSGPLADQQVRRAIVAALDRDQIARTDLEGIDWTPRALNSHIWVENQPDFIDQAEQTGLRFDPDAARDMLDEAGWAVGEDQIRAKDGTRLSVAFTKVKGLKASEVEGQLIQRMLADVGIEVTFAEVELSAYSTEEVMTSGNFELLVVSETANPAPLMTVGERYAADAASNWSGWSSPEFEELIGQIAVESDPEKRVELGHRADTMLWEAAPAVPLYQLPESVAAKRNLANYGAFGLGTPVWTDVGFVGGQ